MRLATRLLWVMAAAACASEAPARREDAANAAAAAPADTPEASQAREHTAKTLLDCARLTYGSAEVPIDAELSFDATSRPVGLVVEGGGPLMCPADRPNVKDVLGTGGGAGWGRPVTRGYRADVWCGPNLDGTPGECSMQLVNVEPEPAKSSGQSGARPSSSKPSGTTGPVGRAEEPMHYDLRRIGADIHPPESINLEPTLLPLDAALLICLHSRQPKVPAWTSTDFSVSLRMGKSAAGTRVPIEVTGGDPAELTSYLFDCVRPLVSEDVASGATVDVRYGVVMSPAKEPVAAHFQRAEVELLEEQVETGAPAPVRRAFAEQLRLKLFECVDKNPIELRPSPNRWLQLDPLVFEGTVDANSKSALRVRSLIPAAHSTLDAQARCTVEAIPRAEQGTEARARWVFLVRFVLNGDALPVPPPR